MSRAPQAAVGPVDQERLLAGRGSQRGPVARFLRSLLGFARFSPLGAVCALVLIALVVLAILGQNAAPYSAVKSQSLPLKGPSAAHLFGTDEVGRDVFSRIVVGARDTVSTSFGALIIGTLSGVVIGLLSGYLGGWPDSVIQRFVDALMAFPLFLLLLMVVSVLGNSARNATIALGVIIMPTVARIVRSAVLSEKQRTYIEASRVVGASGWRIGVRHLLPNIVPIIIVVMTVNLGQVIIAEASLSFLGLGAQPPTPAWGRMLSGAARTYMTQAPHLAIFAGVTISVVVLAFNILGDSLRDWLDPKERQR